MQKRENRWKKAQNASENRILHQKTAILTRGLQLSLVFFQHKPYILIRRPSQRAFQECEKQDNDIKINTMKKLKYLGIVYMVLKYIRLFLLVKEMFM